MLRDWTRRLRRGLVGLLVLSIALLSAAQVRAQFEPALNVLAPTMSPSPAVAHDHDHATAHDKADQPCKGHERAHGVACCLAGSCPLLTAQPPVAPSLALDICFAPLAYVSLASARLERGGDAPDPPPPRSIV